MRSVVAERGFANWPAMRPTLTTGSAGRVGQDDRHLQQDPQLLADRDRRGVVERLGAVTGLEQERAPGGDLGERVAQRARLAREHERRHAAQLLARASRRGRRPATRAAAAPRARATRRVSRGFR